MSLKTLNIVDSYHTELQQWLSKIEASHPSEIEMGLDRTLTVYSKLRTGRVAKKIIVVAGTNGKGSTIAMIEHLLLKMGLSVGVYTSPHIETYNERIRINGKNVDDRRIVESFEKVESVRGGVPLTYFEFGTLGAIHCLASEKLDVAILEVGLGGRLDAVNIIDADLAIITSVDIDHTEWLGSDRESIGFEKAGILRVGIPAIYGESNPPHSVTQQATAQNVRLLTFQQDFGVSIEHSNTRQASGNAFITDRYSCKKDVFMPDCLLPESNILMALQAVECLGLMGDAQALTDELNKFSVEGRLEVVSDKPQVLLDVGHNPHAAKFLSTRLKTIAQGRPVYAVFSALSDKDVEGVVEHLALDISVWHIAPLDCPRAKNMSELGQVFEERNLKHVKYDSIESAFVTAYEAALHDDALLICFGSFFVVSNIKKYISESKPE